MKKVLVPMAVMVLLLIVSNLAMANEIEPIFLRVGLTEKAEQVTIAVDEDQLLISSNENPTAVLSDLLKCEIKITPEGLLLNEELQQATSFKFATRRGLLRFKNSLYRGEMHVFLNSDGLLTVVNYLAVEDYLRGVVPAEMPASWNEEALKAQALAARTYTYSTLRRHQSSGYDLCATTHCHVYGGVKVENPNTDRVIAETYGQVITYNQKLISAVYHSTSGGLTENISRVWGGTVPYLQSVSDWDQLSPRYLWSKEFSLSELQEKVTAQYPEIGNIMRVEQQLAMNETDPDYYLLVGDLSRIRITAEKFRFLLGLYSSKMNIVTLYGADLSVCLEWTGDAVPIVNVLFEPETTNESESKEMSISENADISETAVIEEVAEVTEIAEVEEVEKIVEHPRKDWDDAAVLAWVEQESLQKLICIGGGWGHRVGMSQWGARGMADNGFTAEQIIMHYYQDVDITDVETVLDPSFFSVGANNASDDFAR